MAVSMTEKNPNAASQLFLELVQITNRALRCKRSHELETHGGDSGQKSESCAEYKE